ncbi:hypothetical protein cyc_03363 [Cyclospora cayetanensis]|uniref:Uncharacterized protein n=1 Tax=Cyclospora cayetanensis TaxID=88456 RepID=A0A1D3CUY0_9EIME|nr:hypothetical protein cyc_03363 [Cyclospora cayetanensis]
MPLDCANVVVQSMFGLGVSPCRDSQKSKLGREGKAGASWSLAAGVARGVDGQSSFAGDRVEETGVGKEGRQGGLTTADRAAKWGADVRGKAVACARTAGRQVG